MIKMTKLITWLWHCCQKREKWSWNWPTQIKKREKSFNPKEEEVHYEDIKREIFLFGIILLFWPSLMKVLIWLTSLIWWLSNLVCHQCQRGRLLISDWNKLIVNNEIFELRNVIAECSFNDYFVTDVKLAYCRQDIYLSDLSNIT